ncbi:MAG: general secretion pathway protein GspK [Planctomycetaceae bacterium]|nr:general secretion pathway protein GspK [Planctomycetaceae bacterium]
MKTESRQLDRNRGSALLLVVVVTVLLAVIGVMFLMVSRAGETETGAVVQSKDLDNAVQSVVTRINEVLVNDLFGSDDRLVNADASNPADDDEPWDYPSHIGSDSWLAALEPKVTDPGTPANETDDTWTWPHISDLWHNFGIPGLRQINLQGNASATWIPENSLFGRADADGDGVADSRWAQVPNLSSSRGEPVFAAVRIIDNCAMLNLNAASCFDGRLYSDGAKTSPFKEPWKYWDSAFAQQSWHNNNGSGSGRYLTEINYLPFLRGRDLNGNFFLGSSGGDYWYNLMIARGLFRQAGPNRLPALPEMSQNLLMNIEQPGGHFFDIGDELEIRNRFLLTSPTEARFECRDIANFTLDSGGGVYAALLVPRDNGNPISDWYERLNPTNFDSWAGGTAPYVYDRRHVCTFYSFDRNIRRGEYPLLEQEIASGSMGEISPDRIRSLLIPKGPATTDIRNLSAAQSYNNVLTRKRILQLLFAFREYFYSRNGHDVHAAALSAAQVVANIIDFSDNTGANGPFASSTYGTQQDEDCTFITEQMVEDMILEVSTATLPFGFTLLNFGLDPDDIVFGYERQPFISEVYAQWDGSAIPPASHLKGFAIELVNPYDDEIDITNLTLKIGTTINHSFTNSAANPVTKLPAHSLSTGLGRLVIQVNSTGSVPGGSFGYNISGIAWTALENDLLSNANILLVRAAPKAPGDIYVDKIGNADVRKILGSSGNNALKRDDNNWKFVYADYQAQHSGTAPFNYVDTLGLPNNLPAGTIAKTGFQIAVPDNAMPVARWHDLETLSIQGNGVVSDPDAAITYKLSDPNNTGRFDLIADPNAAEVLNYVCTINRPEIGSLPGRININTAPVHVIAAAIPPSLVDPNAADSTKIVTFSALQLAQAIVNYRNTAPFKEISDLLDVQADSNNDGVADTPIFKRYYTGGISESENVGSQSIDNDIEERDWILSNLANKFTVRSDTFTAYILVRAGEAGPQRRMIAIFDRSQVWTKNDRPKLVALHPVPDPR